LQVVQEKPTAQPTEQVAVAVAQQLLEVTAQQTEVIMAALAVLALALILLGVLQLAQVKM
jgi:hypothetical protein